MLPQKCTWKYIKCMILTKLLYENALKLLLNLFRITL